MVRRGSLRPPCIRGLRRGEGNGCATLQLVLSVGDDAFTLAQARDDDSQIAGGRSDFDGARLDSVIRGAAVFFYSPDRAGVHPEQHLAGYAGILQADAYAGFNALYAPDRKGGPITEAGCWAHARRKLFELADIASKARKGKPTTISPIAFEAVQRFDAIFALERSINGLSPAERVAARRKDIAPLVNDLIEWMKRERGKLSRHNDVAKAMDYMLKRIDVFTRFLDDGRICLSNNAAERELRGIALGRKSWLFAGSDRGGERAAVMLTLIQTAKLNDVDPQAWLADVLARINDLNIHRLDDLLPWNWAAGAERRKVAA